MCFALFTLAFEAVYLKNFFGFRSFGILQKC